MSRSHTRSPALRATLFGLALCAGCTATARRQWLDFFFDDVPPEPTVTAAAAVPAPRASTDLPEAYRRADAVPAIVSHEPYADRQCGACHESAFSQKLRGEVGEVCQLCHRTLFATAKFRHAPAEAGDCLECHHPHESPERFLLVQQGQALCRGCHDAKDEAATRAHAAIGQAPCQTCHDPHGGANRFYLKPPASPTPP